MHDGTHIFLRFQQDLFLQHSIYKVHQAHSSFEYVCVCARVCVCVSVCVCVCAHVYMYLPFSLCVDLVKPTVTSR